MKRGQIGIVIFAAMGAILAAATAFVALKEEQLPPLEGGGDEEAAYKTRAAFERRARQGLELHNNDPILKERLVAFIDKHREVKFWNDMANYLSYRSGYILIKELDLIEKRAEARINRKAA